MTVEKVEISFTRVLVNDDDDDDDDDDNDRE